MYISKKLGDKILPFLILLAEVKLQYLGRVQETDNYSYSTTEGHKYLALSSVSALHYSLQGILGMCV